jgi:hypothetical protein
MCVSASGTQNYLYQLEWPTTTWTADTDNITFYYIKPTGKHKRLFLVTPQARIIANLALRVKSCWALRSLGHNEPIAYQIIKLENEEARQEMAKEAEERRLEEEFQRQQKRRPRFNATKAGEGPALEYALTDNLLARALEHKEHLMHANSLGNIRARETGGSQREGLSRSDSVRSMGGGGGGSSRNSILDLNRLSRVGDSDGGGSMESVESIQKEEEYMAKVRTNHSTVLLTKGPKKSMSQIYKSLTTSTAKRISKASFDYDQFLTVAGPADVVDMRENRGSETQSLPSKRY